MTLFAHFTIASCGGFECRFAPGPKVATTGLRPETIAPLGRPGRGLEADAMQWGVAKRSIAAVGASSLGSGSCGITSPGPLREATVHWQQYHDGGSEAAPRGVARATLKSRPLNLRLKLASRSRRPRDWSHSGWHVAMASACCVGSTESNLICRARSVTVAGPSPVGGTVAPAGPFKSSAQAAAAWASRPGVRIIMLAKA